MAGTPYYFFPTDFYYPRPAAKSLESIGTDTGIVPRQQQTNTDNDTGTDIGIVPFDSPRKDNKKFADQASTSMSLLLPSPYIIQILAHGGFSLLVSSISTPGPHTRFLHFSVSKGRGA
ncbi:unnamed protein product [Citrullus colocynthis]|uniref:Uncharacterized protein n=1 Tax=Citrullus colocynthis TaxID=252529 RepID=A0ABP0YVD0_9ROSI